MKRINKKTSSINMSNIDTDTYVLVYNERDWEGGIISEMSLKIKSEFYDVASHLSSILFDIFDFYQEMNIYIGPFLEMSNYCSWKNINDFDLVRELKSQLKPTKHYMANVKKDKRIIESLIEGNMRYLTQSYFYLPTKQILIQVGHHTAFVAFSENLEILNDEFAFIIENYSGWHCELKSFHEN